MLSSVRKPELSIIAPAHDEGENLAILVDEITHALDPIGLRYEIIIVDDASTDDTAMVLQDLKDDYPQLIGLRMKPTRSGCPWGQSAAFQTGIDASRGQLIATLDADLQNDPADLPRLLARIESENIDLVQGDRSGRRQDSLPKRFGSLMGRLYRKVLLSDSIRDTGCSLRIMTRDVALALPLQYRGMHRFIPVMARQLGFRVIEAPVHHRPRRAGRTKYSNFSRAIPGFLDGLVVRWMSRRRTNPIVSQIEGSVMTRSETPTVETKQVKLRETIGS